MVYSDCPTPPARPIQISIKCVEPNGNLHRSLSLTSNEHFIQFYTSHFLSVSVSVSGSSNTP